MVQLETWADIPLSDLTSVQEREGKREEEREEEEEERRGEGEGEGPLVQKKEEEEEERRGEGEGPLVEKKEEEEKQRKLKARGSGCVLPAVLSLPGLAAAMRKAAQVMPHSLSPLVSRLLEQVIRSSLQRWVGGAFSTVWCVLYACILYICNIYIIYV